MPKTYKWTVEFEVCADWVADGFNMTDEIAQDMIMHQLKWATGHEVNGRVIKRPDANRIAKEQGYATAEQAGIA